MLTAECLGELQGAWLPNMTDAGLDRLVDLLEKGSPFLVHGCFTRAVPMGCLASHLAWHHPETAHLTLDAGITWLHRVAGLNPATSEVLRPGTTGASMTSNCGPTYSGSCTVNASAAGSAEPRATPAGAGRGLKDLIMLPRILEPEVMDSPEEARDYDAMDHSGVNRLFVADFLACWNGQNPILDVGTGTAQIPIELCRQHAAARVTAIDLAEHMLRVGRANVDRAGLAQRITLECRDAKALPYARGRFAAVISNSIVHHIPAPAPCWRRWCACSGPAAACWSGTCSAPTPTPRCSTSSTCTPAGPTPISGKCSATPCAALTLAEVQALIAPLGFAPESVRRTTDRHWTWRIGPDV